MRSLERVGRGTEIEASCTVSTSNQHLKFTIIPENFQAGKG
jgi:hypothetical protein